MFLWCRDPLLTTTRQVRAKVSVCPPLRLGLQVRTMALFKQRPHQMILAEEGCHRMRMSAASLCVCEHYGSSNTTKWKAGSKHCMTHQARTNSSHWLTCSRATRSSLLRSSFNFPKRGRVRARWAVNGRIGGRNCRSPRSSSFSDYTYCRRS